MTGRSRRHTDERGVGTVLTAAVAMVLVVVTSAACTVVAWLATVSDAQDAADAAALAGASAMAEGLDGCDAATLAARFNHAAVTECEVRGDHRGFVVELDVKMALHPKVPGFPEEVVRTAAAGTA
ncbi:hypothetical protein LKO27_13350 [Tessaracoccus sp. OS52]|uniref:Rv3654c family TadE-like protein n=1 Tax=Tessaracoccus sp. OS52 TaxID=2886691 RepID=UPI001D1050D6|nr:Rv3654c family TadE-like protein [Tessaracoccus sp. OS52]MCC2594390.1 hypothetical protein [Tessaracoccus sp. OS52]